MSNPVQDMYELLGHAMRTQDEEDNGPSAYTSFMTAYTSFMR